MELKSPAPMGSSKQSRGGRARLKRTRRGSLWTVRPRMFTQLSRPTFSFRLWMVRPEILHWGRDRWPIQMVVQTQVNKTSFDCSPNLKMTLHCQMPECTDGGGGDSVARCRLWPKIWQLFERNWGETRPGVQQCQGLIFCHNKRGLRTYLTNVLSAQSHHRLK